MDVNTTTSTSAASTATTVESEKTGFAALNADDFMKLLLTQLQNQDPSEPTSNEELLNQLSSMQSLASSIELGDTLKDIVSNQQLTDGAAFLGSYVTGDNDQNVAVDGVVDRVVMREGSAYLGIGEQEIPVRNVTQVNALFAQ
ncbi:flagellar hook assembly protein FlgD [Symmachiella dynata]|jgi:flagellar basal-body rod modification protein FlgD|uniref:Basal-body rod modification protein FlgD n=1 Tax=Symmachiella dynata TaxID=2527995 RepID=A0A517ZGP2_9PLAN|nr:flagellar hook capping FlgD N-terminal domain-containing protein [Symmachiella dynata]QDT46077.1 flagellar basal body rod modification protein [Symmachiella dynata]QDU41644.1 flagellar basal body rod modification protein [Symmachiella dynata]|tara:strand:- start:200 stop:628 length:429 start_codon:yes stop_codon:yes gene_type:complete